MKSDNLRHFRPVGLAMHSIGRYIVVHSVEEAAEALLTGWPTDDGEAYFEAVKVCFDGRHDRATPEDVRRALIRAAFEANVMVIQ
ncbi:DUF982 domain-containing protein [Rhizobium sp. LC145]|uniref:DUF982 domain-containing protein n=1 Tax=Rhizobium sp. LC145 TaxID=1120688 RepID=UPI00062A1034|nr:DUF982 domain-containing protein [Rhizobium sp. LC145]KKX25312.1 hypothetical protein YH62_25540 [Rhizobium sp. LC145]TKT45336.1 DUF982 domain-containing protein [Rhizobiaceae bacterium LC148]